MILNRRDFAVLSLSALAACGPAPQSSQTATRAPRAALRTAPNAGFDAYIQSFAAKAKQRGIAASVIAQAFADARFMPGVIELDRNQAEFHRPLVDYIALVAPEQKIAPGRRAYAVQKPNLQKIEAAYGVPAHILGGIWGAESSFGTQMGDFPVFSATGTLAFEGRRRRFFEAQMLDALRLMQAGAIRKSQMFGSWAGAMGHTQLIPTAFRGHKTDFTGDGRFDAFGPNPSDALAATAKFLARAGWRRGQDWGLEVLAPSGLSGRRSMEGWRSAGLRNAQGGALPKTGTARLLRPSGANGPAFLTFANFETIQRYNPSQNYALAVGYLAGRLQGNGPLKTAFPPDKYGLRLEDRKAIQRFLNAQGLNVGTVDGVFGKKTFSAIETFERGQSWPVTGLPSARLLRRARGA